ncbi:MAG: ADOP family duplicated permease [Acidobacteriaceae bacterium]
MTRFHRMFSRRRMTDDLSEEMRQHLEEKIEALVADGMPREEAVHAARRAFGNATLIEQRSREVWMWPLIESLWADIKFALRQLRKSPGITLIAVITLALGIGANTAVFTLTWAVILKGLPVPHPDRLVEYEMRNGDQMIGLSGPEYAALRRQQKSCIDLLAWASDSASVRKGDALERRVHIQLLSGNAFHVLEMQPYLGNFFSERTDTNEGVRGIPVVLSYDYWQEKFHGDRALGQTLVVAGHPVTVVGIMPRAFEGLTANFHPALYLPFSFADLLYGKDFRNHPGHFGHFVLGRLKPGMTVAAARAEVKAIEPSVRKEADPTGIYMDQFFKPFRLRVQDGRSGVSWVKATYGRPLLVLEMLVAFLLLLCCLNTALVMLARVSGRQQEYAVRSALGAGRVRLIRQVLIETVLLTIPGLLAGLLMGWAAARALVAMLGTMGSASSMDVRPNAIILGFNVAVSLLVAFGAGLWPAFRAAKTTPAFDLKTSDRTVAARQMGGWVVVLQVAVSVSLVTSAVLLGGTLGRLLTEHSGFHAQATALAYIDVSAVKPQPAETARIVDELLRKVQQKPGVMTSGFTDARPLIGFFGASREFGIDARGNVHTDPHIFYIRVSPGYFDAIGTRLLTGESAAPTAKDSMPQCVLSRDLAAFFFPGENAVGRIVYASTFQQPDGANLDPKNGCRVVGIAENARLVSLRTAAPRVIYNVISPSVLSRASLDAFSGSNINLIVRAKTDALAVAALQEAVKQTLPNSAEVKYQTFHQLEDQDLNRERMLVSMSGAFAVLALLLTALGMYGLLTRNVVLRTKEIGIRVALGAQKRQVVAAIARKALIEVGIGLLAGAAITMLLVKAIRRLLEEPQPTSEWTYLISASVILLVAGIALYFPARRAASIDPMVALRAE